MTAIVGQGLGPFERWDLIAIAKRVLPKINFISLREGLYGLHLLQRLGAARDRVAVTGDDAIELTYQRHPRSLEIISASMSDVRRIPHSTPSIWKDCGHQL